MKMPICRELLNKWKRNKNSAEVHRTILKASVSCEPWGFDCMRYKFKDGDYLVYDKINKEWMR